MERNHLLFARVVPVIVAAATVLFLPQPASAHRVPQTLAERRPVTAGPVAPGFPIDYLGVLWESERDAERPIGSHGEVRFRQAGGWGPWIRLIEDGAEEKGLWASGLIPAGDAAAYQIRDLPPEAERPRAVAINSTDGPLVEVGEGAGGAFAAEGACRSRADWGADETLRFDDEGNEVWPPAFYPVQTLTVHHTATDNDDPDPESTVRAIYRYHAVDRGWGDIGYQYLIDESGMVYEGRWSGTESASCETAGRDGSDFGHETTDLDGDGVDDEMVTAAHVGGYNSGNMGLALLGEFTEHPRFGGEPKDAAVDSLEDELAALSLRHDLDPQGTVHYVNPVSGDERTVDTISGHRDWKATECPGQRLHDRLPAIRQDVAEKMAGSDGEEETSDTMHVGDLDGAAEDRKNQWRAHVTVTVTDHTGTPIAEAAVEAIWQHDGSTVGCSTGSAGTCAVASEWTRKRTQTLTLRVEDLSHPSYTYDPQANDDPDGDSDGTSITVAKDK